MRQPKLEKIRTGIFSLRSMRCGTRFRVWCLFCNHAYHNRRTIHTFAKVGCSLENWRLLWNGHVGAAQLDLINLSRISIWALIFV